MTRCGRLHNIFDFKYLFIDLKIRLYVKIVYYLLIYGAKTWYLNEKKTRRKLNDDNRQMLTRITGKSVSEEARPRTMIFDLVISIRKRRLCWIGHILCGEENRLVYQAIVDGLASETQVTC